MSGIPRKLMATGFLACGLFACAEIDPANLPIRDTPQSQAPSSGDTSGQPLRGNAVAVDLGGEAL